MMTRGPWLAAATAALVAGCADLPPTTQEQLSGQTIRYACRDGTTFLAEFDAGAQDVRLTFKDRQVVLRQVASTDAFLRFNDGQTGFGTNGYEAVVADQIRIVHGDCRAQ
jgi:membrane-bound inhibitor of C-type lysozyme